MIQKFTEFYYSVDEETHPASDATDIPEFEYKDRYRGKIFCPGCHSVPLLLCHRSKATFLKAFPKREHNLVDGEPCSFVSKTKPSVIDALIEQNIKDYKRIDSILSSALRALDKSDVAEPKSKVSGESKTELESKCEGKHEHKQQSRAPRCSWSSWNKDLPPYYHVVYGKVKVRIVNTTKSVKDNDGNPVEISHRFIQVYLIKPYKLVGSIKANDIALDMKDGVYNLAVYAKPWIYKDYVNCELKYSNSIKYSLLSSE